jgi:carboxymethylenebutenolidase
MTRAAAADGVLAADGVTDWIRGVADQLASEGFVTLVPDLSAATGEPDDRTTRWIEMARAYGLQLPAVNGRSAVVGFGWGGFAAAACAARQPTVNAAVVYDAPQAAISSAHVPVLALYGGDDSPDYPGTTRGFLRDQMSRDANMIATENAWPRTIAFLRKYLDAAR